jgi:hypothetical protein
VGCSGIAERHLTLRTVHKALVRLYAGQLSIDTHGSIDTFFIGR